MDVIVLISSRAGGLPYGEAVWMRGADRARVSRVIGTLGAPPGVKRPRDHLSPTASPPQLPPSGRHPHVGPGG